MDSPPSSLEDLRREIDLVDDALHDLIMQRTALVQRIALEKPADQPALRPGREAVILRRLVARHRGALSPVAVLRIWRELISALTNLQKPLAVAVYAPANRRDLWDVARDHYGTLTAATAVTTAVAALRAVSDGKANIAVVPWPQDNDPDPWWRFLNSNDGKVPRVVARLPFFGRVNGRGEDGDALALALSPAEETGNDKSLLCLELRGDISRGRLKETLESVRLSAIGFCSWFGGSGGGGVGAGGIVSLHLVEIAGYLDGKDSRLAALRERMGAALLRATPIGSYAEPIPAPVKRG